MGVRRNTSGPLFQAQLVQVNEVVFWDRTLPPRVDPTDTDEPYIIQAGDRHDLLATRKLKSAQQGWIIMERNRSEEDQELDMRLWPNDFVPGANIMIPSRDTIRARGISS